MPLLDMADRPKHVPTRVEQCQCEFPWVIMPKCAWGHSVYGKIKIHLQAEDISNTALCTLRYLKTTGLPCRSVFLFPSSIYYEPKHPTVIIRPVWDWDREVRRPGCYWLPIYGPCDSGLGHPHREMKRTLCRQGCWTVNNKGQRG